MTSGPATPLDIHGLDAAVVWIERWIGSVPRRTNRGPVIGITGPVGSGKSTLASRLAGAVGASVVSTDRYLPDYAQVPVDERDEPGHADLYRLAHDLDSMVSNGSASLPVWSFHAHRRVGEEPIRCEGPVICEGLFALHPDVRPRISLSVFVSASVSTRWDRWERIELSGERGMGVERARLHFETVAEPTFAGYSEHYRAAADLVVHNDEAITR